MKILSKEYDSNELIDTSTAPELLKTIMLFDRETFVVNTQHNKEYYKDDANMSQLFNDNLIMIIHQDSDRDIYLIKD